MTPSLVTDAVVTFLKGIPPFQFLQPFELASLAKTMAVEYFPKDTLILRAGRSAAESLYIIQKGGVKLAIHTGVGKEFILDMRSEGEMFGLLSLMGRDVARLDVTSVEDTLCYTIPATTVQQLIASHADVADYLLRTSVTRYIDRSINELREQTRLMGDSERLLYSLTVGAVAEPRPLICEPGMSILEAAQRMAAAHASCLIVSNKNEAALGIVTDKDLARKVVAAQIPYDAPVTTVMSAPVISVEAGEPVFQALLAMLSRDIHHVLVTRDGLPAGILSNHDLLLLQGKSPLNVVRNIEQQQTLDGLAGAQKRIGDLLPLLLREGARASHITRVVAGVNDRVTAKILQLAEAQLGPSPVAYCWVTTGSEGRAEQTFKTDQDNGIIYADDAGPDAEAYLERLATFTRDALVRCGYPLCPGDYMASNATWRQPLRIWRQYFTEWITEAKRRSVEDALILFDMRPVAGELALFEQLAAHNRELLKTATFFKSVLAFITIDNKPPLGFFRSFVLERTGEHKDALDLKLNGTGPIVNIARLFALDYGIAANNTVDRLAAVEASGSEEIPWKELREAFELLTLFRLEGQMQQSRAGQPLDNHIRPASLTHLQRNLLKEAFQTIARAQSQVDSKYRSAVWSQLGSR